MQGNNGYSSQFRNNEIYLLFSLRNCCLSASMALNASFACCRVRSSSCCKEDCWDDARSAVSFMSRRRASRSSFSWKWQSPNNEWIHFLCTLEFHFSFLFEKNVSSTWRKKMWLQVNMRELQTLSYKNYSIKRHEPIEHFKTL